MTHSVLRYMTALSNTRYLMFNIYSAAEENTLYYVALNIIINNLNIVFYNYITRPAFLTTQPDNQTTSQLHPSCFPCLISEI